MTKKQQDKAKAHRVELRKWFKRHGYKRNDEDKSYVGTRKRLAMDGTVVGSEVCRYRFQHDKTQLVQEARIASDHWVLLFSGKTDAVQIIKSTDTLTGLTP